MEVYVIYNKITQAILSQGKINRAWDSANLDGSTTIEGIQRSLAKDVDRAVIYVPDTGLFDRKLYKVENEIVVPYTQAELDAQAQAEAVEQAELTNLEQDFKDMIDNITYAQVDNYIDNNVTNLAQARAFLKRLTKVVLFLAKNRPIA